MALNMAARVSNVVIPRIKILFENQLFMLFRLQGHSFATEIKKIVCFKSLGFQMDTFFIFLTFKLVLVRCAVELWHFITKAIYHHNFWIYFWLVLLIYSRDPNKSSNTLVNFVKFFHCPYLDGKCLSIWTKYDNWKISLLKKCLEHLFYCAILTI